MRARCAAAVGEGHVKREAVLKVVNLAAREGGHSRVAAAVAEALGHATPSACVASTGSILGAPKSVQTEGRVVNAWGPHLSTRAGHLCFDDVDLVALAERLPTPFFVFSASRIGENVGTLRDAFASRHPKTEVFFASKACGALWVLEQVRRAGVNVEVNSGGELWKALHAGFDVRQIVFNGVAKTEAELSKHPAAYPQILVTSARTGLGIPELRAAVAALAPNGVVPQGQAPL